MTSSDTLVADALAFATQAHAAIKHKRKYTDEDYITHPIAVMEIVRTVRHTPAMLAASLTHDTVEDTGVSIREIYDRFGQEVGDLVSDLTDVSKPEDGNRARRKAIDRAHTAQASDDAKTIKCADLLHNGGSILDFDPSFAVTYMAEKRLLLEVLDGADPVLLERCRQMVANYYDRCDDKGRPLPELLHSSNFKDGDAERQ